MMFRVTVMLNMNVTVTEIKHYQLKNILITLKGTINNLKKMTHGKCNSQQ